MAQKQHALNEIKKISNSGLVELLEKNGFYGFIEILKEKNLTGDQFINLSEFEISRWKLGLINKNKLWAFITNLKNMPEKFTEMQKSYVIKAHKNNINQENFGKTLEKILSEKNKQNKFNNEPTNEYLKMDKPDYNDGYLKPYQIPQNEPPIRVAKRYSYLHSSNHKDICQRKSQALPRNEEIESLYQNNPEPDYILDEEENTYEPSPEVQELTKKTIDFDRKSGNVEKQELKIDSFRKIEEYREEAHKRRENEMIKSNKLKQRPLPQLPINKSLKEPKNYENESQEGFYGNEEVKKIIKKPSEAVVNSLTKKLLEPPKNLVNIEEEYGEEYDKCLFNLNDEKFFRNTDRKGSKQLLKNLDEGAFLFRPSKFYFLTLTVKGKTRFFHIGIEKTKNNKFRCHTEENCESPEFSTLNEMVQHFCKEVLPFQHGNEIIKIYLKRLLTPDIF